uniref:Reverse transcriptase domain-containing protein n=1 Tax=Anolis carolinensis TaxID=28377 RepID=A0A803TDZ5_ANOCA
MELKGYVNNINGLNSPNKRKILFNYLKKCKFDVVSLQETHIHQRHAGHLINKSIGNEYISSAPEKKRGVVTYVNPKWTSELAFKDEEGRMIGVKIKIYNKILLVCNVYTPTGPKTNFINTLKDKIAEQEFEELIIMGDFNGIIDPDLDKKGDGNGGKKLKNGKLPINFQKLLQDWDLKDAWRIHHQLEKDYTFFSNRHKSWSRIDMTWMSTSLIPKISKIRIMPRNYSDHCPIEFIINKTQKTRTWRLNGNLLKSEEDIIKNKKLIKEYFKINDSDEVTQQIVWEASKAVMRGHFIQQAAQKNRQRREALNKVLEEIKIKEKRLKEAPGDKRIKQELEIFKKQKTNLELEELEKKLRYIKQQHFQHANKPGRWLAWRIRRKKQSQHIIEIKTEGKYYTTEQEIVKQFYKFYSKLYTKDQIKKEEIMSFIGKQKLAKITDQQREKLNKEISEQEIKKIIRKIDGNKAPGPDGLTGIYYKVFIDELTPYLKKIMNRILDNNEIPDSWKLATITMIHKEGQDPQNVKNYRPISLLNQDYKIFTCILADRLKEVLKVWIKEEQSGFLPGRQLKDNVREIVDIIEYYEKSNKEEIALLAIDMEKAFDSVNWDFFKILINELDMGYRFNNAINKIYEKQEATIRINSIESKKFKISKGTRQGCPLSPLLFIFALETLINSVREDTELKGAKIRKEQYKIKAYADDLICIIEEPVRTVGNWLNKLENFGKISGLKINKDKTTFLTKNMTEKRQFELTTISGIKVSKKIKYLGIILTAKNSQLIENNYDTRWKDIQKHLATWKDQKLSFMGRIAAMKMTILPKMLFLFQCIPIIRNAVRFKKWNKDINKFIWSNKKPRIKRAYMIDEKKRGGLALPDLQLYHEACGLMWIRDWTTLKKTKLLTLEGVDLRFGWHAYLWYEKRKIDRNFGDHFIRSSLIKIWDKYKRRIFLKTPLWVSPLEACQRREMGGILWPKYKDILTKEKGIFEPKTQEILSQDFKNIGWFQYAQIKEYFNIDKKIGFEDKETCWDKIIQLESKIISKIYKKILEWKTEQVSIKECMTKWARNIGYPIKLEEWEKCWNKRLKYTYSVDLKENWIKIFFRWHLTPQKLSKIYKKPPTNAGNVEIRKAPTIIVGGPVREPRSSGKKYIKIYKKSCQSRLI